MNRFFTSVIALLSFVTALYVCVTHTPVRHDKYNQEEEHSGALQALSFWTASRAYPYNDIPADRYYRSFMESKRKLKQAPRSTFGDYDWQFLGPVNLSGRTIALALNPINGTTLYAGSASGGLWRSYTGGINGHWERITTGYPVLGVNAIDINPLDTNTIYIGTGEVYSISQSVGGTVIRVTRGSYGIGILKSTDNGVTWVKSLDWSYNDQQGVQVIKINPSNPNTIWAGTTDGVYKSSDAGTTWERKLWRYTVDLLINPLDTNSIMVSTGNFRFDTGLILTTDGGESWNGMSLPTYTGKTTFGMCASNPNIVYASIADDTTGVSSVWRTDDFGSTWVKKCDQTTAGVVGVQGWYSHYVAVSPSNPNTIIYGGVNMIKSTDGGSSFISANGSYSDHHTFAISTVNPNILYDANDDGIYRSTNFGSTFSYVSSGYNTGQFYNGFSNSTTDSLMAIGQVQDHIPGYKYTGSATWSRSAVDEVGWTAITPGNDSIMFAVYRGGGVVERSTDRGGSFFGVVSFNYDQAWLSPIAVSQSNPNVVYFGRDKVFKSTSYGSNGSFAAVNNNNALDGNPSLSIAIAPTNSNYVYIGTAPTVTNAHIWKTTNGGTSWINITSTLPDRYPNDIAVSPTDPNTAYVALGGFLADHFYKTTNGGSSWIDISSSLPDIPGTAVMVDPLNPNTVFVGNDVGVYVSNDAGATWNNFSDGLPEAVLVSDLTYSASNRTIRVTTHGNGVYERKLPNSFPAVFVDAPNGGELWLGNREQNIQWTSFLVDKVKIEYSTDDGSSWNLIADSVSASSLQYHWTTPTLSSEKAKIRISSDANPSISDVSNSDFTISFSGTINSVATGWNLVSLPVSVSNPTASSVYENAISPAYLYAGSYVQKESLTLGSGYWLKFGSPTQTIIEGDSVLTDTFHVVAGWNLIGSITSPILTSAITSEPSNIVQSQFYEYNHGYTIAGSIQPGKGYWVKTSSNGKLIVTSSATSKQATVASILEQYNQLRISDNTGNMQTLYFGKHAAGDTYNNYDLPPLPPSEIFDVRFTSQHLVELLNDNANGNFPIVTQGVRYPITISWDISPNTSGWNLSTGKDKYSLIGSGSVVLNNNEETQGLKLSFSQLSSTTPAQTQLLPNYPNPFNPSTQIRFDIGKQGHVAIRILNSLGQVIEQLANETMEAGTHSLSWNASDQPSGVYFVQLQTNNEMLSRKILLLK